MKHITFGHKKLSKLSLGTVQFGLDYGIANRSGQPKQEDVNEIIDYVYSKDLNCFDTAQAYGSSEKVLGFALKNIQNPMIISKLKSELFIDNLDLNIENSLQYLNQKTIFGLMLHDSQLLYAWKDEYSDFVDKLTIDKKIDYFGVSIYSDNDFKLALDNDKIDIIQIPFNIFDQRAITLGWLELAKERNKLIFIRSIFLQGLFFMNPNELKGTLTEAKKYLIRLHSIADKYKLTISQLAMAYVDTMAKESILLFGCDTLAQAKENIESFNNLQPLSEKLIEEIERNFSTISENISNPTLWKTS